MSETQFLSLSEGDVHLMLQAFFEDPEAAATYLLVAAMAMQVAESGMSLPREFVPLAFQHDVDKVTTLDDTGHLRLRWGRIVKLPAPAASAPPPAPPLAVVEPSPPPPASEPIPLRPAPPHRLPGLPKEYPQNLVGQMIHAAGVQIDPTVPLYWHRQEHQVEAVDLVSRSGLSSDDLVARVRAAKDRPTIRRVSQLADLIGGRRG